jgi:hypothetical protein
MKKIVFAVLALMAAGAAGAQAPALHPIVGTSPATTPQTTVKVYLTIERDAVRTGPYARYAQKYLGVIAPLSDRADYVVLAGRIDYADPAHRPETIAQPPLAFDNEFGRVSIDRTSTSGLGTEEMAREAANTLFRLRQQRLDILTGDAGELYPSGLGEALAEINRLEKEYLELFLGKRTRTAEVREFDVVPVAGKAEYVVAEIPAAGGEQVVLTLVPEGGARAVEPLKGDKRPTTQYRVADFAAATLRAGTRELATARIPVYQFGVTITGPVL